MAKPHKYAWNGVDVETTLSFEQLANMAERAAQQSTGDLTHGRHRVVSTRSNERRIEFLISDYLVSYTKCMVFHLDFAQRDGRTWMTSGIDWYDEERPKVIGIPAGGKTMIGHYTYMQFARALSDQVRLADSRARVSVREGKRPNAPTVSADALMAAVATGCPPEARPAVPRPTVPYPQGGSPTAPPPRTAPASPHAPSSPQAAPASNPAPVRWQLCLPEGDVIPIAPAAVLGRNPVAPAQAAAAVPVALRDKWLSVSKTHALLCVQNGDLWVTDLHSTNGTRLRDPDGDVFPCEPGTPHAVNGGWQVSLGEYRVRIVAV